VSESASTSTLSRIERVLAATYEAGSIEDDDGRMWPLHPTAVGARQGAQLADLVARSGAERTLEIGFAFGLSCLQICRGLLRAGGRDPRHLAIDPTESAHWRNAGRRLIERAGAAEMTELIEEESQLVLPRLASQGRSFSFDLAFIDGDHRFDPVFIDLFFAHRLVRPGGLIVVDDMWMPPIRLAVAYFETNLGLELVPDAIPDGFRWRRRRRLVKGVPSGFGTTAVLRRPPLGDRPWDDFVEFF
jgi:predicted O-methyltransferase YrrM